MRTWRYCSKCGDYMAWLERDIVPGFDRRTGQPVRSYWLIWACPKWLYVYGNGHDAKWTKQVIDEAVA